MAGDCGLDRDSERGASFQFTLPTGGDAETRVMCADDSKGRYSNRVHVDDDEGVRDAIQGLLTAEGWRSESFDSPQAFLQRSKVRDGPCCLVLDVRMPGANGLEFQQQLAGRRSTFRSSSSRGTGIYRCR